MDVFAELFAQAASLMVMGMGLVFIFLGLLVVALNVMARFCAPDARPNVATPKPAANGLTPQLCAAITAAVHQHRTQ